LAAFIRTARIVCAGVAVIAIDLCTSEAVAIGARVVHGAEVAIGAGGPVIGPGGQAEPGGRGAGGNQAGGVGPGRFRALYNRPLLNATAVGEGGGITMESAIAEVSILQRETIVILDAVTVHRRATTLSISAKVAGGARVAIVTGAEDRVKFAPSGGSAGILCAGIIVIALYGVADADSLFAVVCHSTGVAILAFASLHRSMIASLFAQADVVGALVFIVTALFVDISVAVIVHTVADFRGRSRGITV